MQIKADSAALRQTKDGITTPINQYIEVFQGNLDLLRGTPQEPLDEEQSFQLLQVWTRIDSLTLY
jgi:hypothetical protein